MADIEATGSIAATSQRPHLVLHLQGFIGQLRVAGAENSIWFEFDADFVAESLCHVDIGNHPEALISQRISNLRYSFIQRRADGFREVI